MSKSREENILQGMPYGAGTRPGESWVALGGYSFVMLIGSTEIVIFGITDVTADAELVFFLVSPTAAVLRMSSSTKAILQPQVRKEKRVQTFGPQRQQQAQTLLYD